MRARCERADLEPLPSGDSFKVLVLNDAGAGVCNANVTIGPDTGVTGRSGRGDLFANPRGILLVQIDATAATATAADRLVGYTFAAEVPGPDLPLAVFLPDTAPSAVATVSRCCSTPITT